MVLKTIDLTLIVLCITNALRYLRDFVHSLLLIGLEARWLDDSSELFRHKFLASGHDLLSIIFLNLSSDFLLNIILNSLFLDLDLGDFLG